MPDQCLWVLMLLSKRKHTHNALDDAIEQAEIFEKMLKTQQKDKKKDLL